MSAQFPQFGRRPQDRRRWIKRATVALPLLCLLIFGTIIGVRLAGSAVGANADTFAPIKGQVPALVRQSTLLGPTDASQSLALSVGLQLRNADSLKAYVDSASRTKSINAHHHLTQAQIAAAYAPLASSQQAVISYLQSYGFQVTSTGKLHLVIGFQGTVGDAENAFHIQINNYRSPKGQNFYAPASDPSVPIALARLIQNVAGLSNSVHFSHPPIRKLKSSNPKIATTSNANCSVNGGYTPAQIASAYNLNSFYNAGFKGDGQTVALFELDDYSSGDISNYTSCLGGKQVPINRISVDGGAKGAGAGAIEVELDMELILSAAPHLAALDVYEGPKPGVLTDAQYLDVWSRIITDASASIISTSWGACEANVPQADFQAENNLFAIAAAQGQTIFAASGDTGTNDCRTPISSGQAKLAVDDPASQPYVTGVGGTSLTLNNNAYGSEVVWNNGYDSFSDLVFAGGGGVSSAWPLPSWQQGPGVNSSSSGREVPDVSLDADPNTGYAMYCTVSAACGGFGSWFPIGGTSAAAPMWAAFMALTNEKTLHDGGFNIGFINPYLYQIDQNAGGTSYANDFHDITTGNNDGMNDGGTTYSATANYDMASGLGSYNAWNLANDLEKLANAKNGSRGAPAATTWYFAEGSVGGSFTEYLTILNPSTSTANVTVQYLFQNSAAISKPYSVPASSRFTINVNNELGIAPSGPHKSISAIVNSNVPVVVERPMYFNLGGVQSGTDVVGATTSTNTTFYFAQGAQGQIGSYHASEFLTILNPNSTTVTVTAKYFSGGHQVGSDTLNISALQRGTIVPSYQGQAAIELTASQGIVAERPIYIKGTVPGISGSLTGAASAVGATNPGSDWLFAEGHTSGTFQESLVLANFTSSATTATIKLEYKNGSTETAQCTVNAQSQYYFNVNSPSGNAGCSITSPGTPTSDVSAEVTAPTASLVAERVMYFKYGSIPGTTDAVGEAGSSNQTVYSFAEGYTGGQFSEYLTLQNPTANAEVVAITLFADNMIIEKEVTLQPTSRTTFLINDIINPIVNAYPASGSHNVSMVVQAFNGGKVIAERPMYFNYGGDLGGTDVIGFIG
jgi:kumamolisin